MRSAAVQETYRVIFDREKETNFKYFAEGDLVKAICAIMQDYNSSLAFFRGHWNHHHRLFATCMINHLSQRHLYNYEPHQLYNYLQIQFDALKSSPGFNAHGEMAGRLQYCLGRISAIKDRYAISSYEPRRINLSPISLSIEHQYSYGKIYDKRGVKSPIAGVYDLLQDYSSPSAFLRGHWNRHHRQRTNNIIKQLYGLQGKTARELVFYLEQQLNELRELDDYNVHGSSLARRLQYCINRVEGYAFIPLMMFPSAEVRTNEVEEKTDVALDIPAPSA